MVRLRVQPRARSAYDAVTPASEVAPIGTCGSWCMRLCLARGTETHGKLRWSHVTGPTPCECGPNPSAQNSSFNSKQQGEPAALGLPLSKFPKFRSSYQSLQGDDECIRACLDDNICMLNIRACWHRCAKNEPARRNARLSLKPAGCPRIRDPNIDPK